MAEGSGAARLGMSRTGILRGTAAGLIAMAGRPPTGAAAQSLSYESAKPFKAAAVVFDPAWGDLDGNIARMVAGIEDVAKQEVRLAVLSETATAGYIFDSFEMVKPYLDTVPGKATSAIEKVTRDYKMYVAVGIAEFDPESGLGYNTAALIGPKGYIGKYRKHGLNSHDQRWTSVGNLGFPCSTPSLEG